MRRAWRILCCLVVTAAAHAQVTQFGFRIHFGDKTGAPPLSSASTFLSARSLQRRASQGIALDSTDRPVSPVYVDSVLHLTSGKLHNTSRWLNDCVILMTDSSKILLLQGKAFISSVAYVGHFQNGLHKSATRPGTTTGMPLTFPQKSTGTAAFYNNSYGQTAMVNGDYLHDLGYKGQGKLIAVLDEGFADVDIHYGFDSLRQQGRIVDKYNFVLDTTYVFDPSNGIHGTASLSTMAGYVPGTYVGSAPLAQYALYLTEDRHFLDALYELDNMVAGMERADSIGADIITTSLGYNDFTSPYIYSFPKTDLDGKTTIVSQGANMAVTKGIFMVASAGNEGGTSWNFLLSPGDADSALTVGAVNPVRAVATFSSPGPNAAGRIKPDVCLQGDPAIVFSSGNSIIGSAGTSFATPQAAGWVACLWQSNPTASPGRLRQAVIRSADRYTAPGAQIGYGIPDFKKAFQSLDVPKPPPVTTVLKVSPNPFGQTILVQLSLPASALVSFILSGVDGRILWSEEVAGVSGSQELHLDLPHFPSGTYMLRTMAGDQSFLNKLTHY